ncbi:MAG: hypothetical protein IPJ31_06735 [Bacteroidetes bacterium]|nr:hypothetical protein [Bacteroidota bacterium]
MNKKMLSLLLSVAMIFSLCQCKEGEKSSIPIRLGDSTLIVTEKDSAYLQNFTNDIAPAKKKSSESQITKMMVQVDSLKASQKMENEANTAQALNGFTINFEECSVVFDGIAAHALNETQNERASHSVSYLKDAGNFLETKLEVNKLTELRAEQRLFVKLSIEYNGETMVLHDLGKFITQWYPLAGKNNRFVSVSSNSLQFDNVDATKIKNALEKELKKKKKNKDEISKWMKAIAQTKSYSDAPCALIPSSSQWRIFGKVDGKSVRKLIQFDIP